MKVAIVDISSGISMVLNRADDFLDVKKKRPIRIRRSKVPIRWRFAFCIFRDDAPKPWLQSAIFMIFELLAGEVLKK